MSDFVAFYVPADEVFPGLGGGFDTFRSLLKGMSRADALLWAGKINLIVGAPSSLTHVQRQLWGIKDFFAPEEFDRLNAYVRSCGGAEKVVVFSRGQLLELIRWAALLSPEDPADIISPDGLESPACFARASLCAADRWHEAVTEGRFAAGKEIDEKRRNSLAAVRKLKEATIRAPEMGLTLGRAALLFEDYMPRCYPDFQKDFRAATGLTVKEYLGCFFGIASNSYLPDHNYIQHIGDHLIWNWEGVAQNTAYKEQFARYLELMSRTPAELQKALWPGIDREEVNEKDARRFNLRTLRDRPLLRLDDGRAIILDPVLFSDSVTAGPLFLAAKAAANAQRLFGGFGDAFEDYVLDVLRQIFPAGSGILEQRFYANVSGVWNGEDFEIDGCLYEPDHRELFVLEVKGKWIEEDTVVSDDVAEYLATLKEKYIEGTKGGEKGAIEQLARVVNLLTDDRFRCQDYPFLEEARRIIPILVTNDRLLTGPLECNFFAREFAERLLGSESVGSGAAQIGRRQVTPLILLSIDDVENLETSSEGFRIRDVFIGYSDAHPERLADFHAYLRSIGKNIYHSQWVKERGARFGEEAKRELFPGQ